MGVTERGKSLGLMQLLPQELVIRIQKHTFATVKNSGYSFFFNQTVAYSRVTIDTLLATFKMCHHIK